MIRLAIISLIKQIYVRDLSLDYGTNTTEIMRGFLSQIPYTGTIDRFARHSTGSRPRPSVSAFGLDVSVSYVELASGFWVVRGATVENTYGVLRAPDLRVAISGRYVCTTSGCCRTFNVQGENLVKTLRNFAVGTTNLEIHTNSVIPTKPRDLEVIDASISYRNESIALMSRKLIGKIRVSPICVCLSYPVGGRLQRAVETYE